MNTGFLSHHFGGARRSERWAVHVPSQEDLASHGVTVETRDNRPARKNTSSWINTSSQCKIRALDSLSSASRSRNRRCMTFEKVITEQDLVISLEKINGQTTCTARKAERACSCTDLQLHLPSEAGKIHISRK
jgi:hypothetical protein